MRVSCDVKGSADGWTQVPLEGVDGGVSDEGEGVVDVG